MPTEAPIPPSGDVLASLASEAGKLVEPLVRAARYEQGRRRLLLILGWDAEELTGFPINELESVAQAVGTAAEQVATLAQEPTKDLASVQKLIDAIATVVDAVRRIDKLAGASTLDVPLNVAYELANVGHGLAEYLMAEYLSVYHPVLHDVLRALTLIDAGDDYLDTPTPALTDASSEVVYRHPAVPPRFRLHRMADLLTNPSGTLRDHYLGDGMATIEGARDVAARLFTRLAPLLMSLGGSVSTGADVPDAVDRTDVDPQRTMAFTMPIGPGTSPHGSDLHAGAALHLLSEIEGGSRAVVLPSGWANHRLESRHWIVVVSINGQLGEFSIGPGGVDVNAGDVLSCNVDVQRVPDADTGKTIIGAPQGTRLELGPVRFGAGVEASTDSWNAQLSAECASSALILSGDDTDGFLATFLPTTGGLRVPFDIGLAWSRTRGLRFTGVSGGLKLSIPTHVGFGPLQVRTVGLHLEPNEGEVALAATLAGDIKLGPMTAAVEGIGVQLILGFPENGGNLGPLNASLGLRPPTGLGLEVEAGPVQGGGFVGFDEATGRYAGVLDLNLGTVGIQALGLLDTKIPGQSDGFALLVLLRASFPPIQLGFGLALSSVGGLLTLNRRIDVDTLRERMITGTAGRILAPEDPIRNAPMLLSDLGAVYPPEPGTTVVGPTLQLSWAQLVRFDIGLFIELPGPRKVVLLGSARAAVENPSGGKPYLQLRLDILGAVDLARQTVDFDAVLVDSHLLEVLELTGGAAFRLSWGAEPYVVLTVGGFHPAYSPAPLVFPPGLNRVAMVRGTPTDVLYLRFEGYFAITTNTLQFGASVEAIINLGPFNIRGFLGFDALIRFQPLHFQFGIEASVNVRWKKHRLGGLELRGRLSGPGPVVFHGKVCFEVLWFDICFEETFRLGSSSPPPVTRVPSALAALVRELEDPGNVHADDTRDPWVVVEPAQNASLPVVSPLGQAVWSQTRAPLRLLLQRFEGALLGQSETVTATGPQVTGDELEWFAPGGYTELTDADALNRRAFERLPSGVRLGDLGADLGPSAGIDVKVRVIRLPAPSSTVAASALPPWMQRAGARRVGATERDLVIPKITLREEEWVLLSDSDTTTGLSQAQAHQLSRVASRGTALAAADLIPAMDF